MDSRRHSCAMLVMLPTLAGRLCCGATWSSPTWCRSSPAEHECLQCTGHIWMARTIQAHECRKLQELCTKILTGQPPCNARSSISPSGVTDQKSTASPMRGLYLNELSSQLRQSVMGRFSPAEAQPRGRQVDTHDANPCPCKPMPTQWPPCNP